MTAHTFDSVRQVFADAGCTLLDTAYANNKQPLRFVCSCGKEGVRVLSKFLKSPFCKSCGHKNAGDKNRRLSLDDARAVFSSFGCTLLAAEYVSNSVKMPYLCKCGSLHEMSLANMKKGKRCPACVGKTQWTFETVSEVYRSHGCELLEDGYASMNAYMRYRCACGGESVTTFGNFLKGVRCKSCGIKKLQGPNNYLYNASKTQADREAKRQYTAYSEWRRKVYERDDYTCQRCGAKGVSLNAHHLESYSHNRELRTELDNGVTLCKPCHHEFHTRYGFFTPTTKQQYFEFEGALNG